MYPFLIGTYTGPGKGKGIYTAMLDSQTGEIIPTLKYATVENPSFIAVSPTHNMVYSVMESGSESGVASYNLNEIQSLIFLNSKVKMNGLDPAYIIAAQKHVITANYSSGDVSVFPIAEDGDLREMTQNVAHKGSSINPLRQSKPHPHMILFTPDQKHILVSDLGIDKIMIYSYNESSNQPLSFVKSVDLPKGSGPRHLTFSYDSSTLFVLGELDGNIHSFDFSNLNLSYLGATSLIYPNRDVKEFNAADIHISPDGKFLYASVRANENLISVFEINNNRSLRPIQNMKTNGMGPRNFAISPDGAWLLVAHQNSHDVLVYRRDEATGKLENTGNFINVSAPVNLTFLPY